MKKEKLDEIVIEFMDRINLNSDDGNYDIRERYTEGDVISILKDFVECIKVVIE